MNYVKLSDLRKIYDDNSSLEEAHKVMKDKNYFSIVLGMYKYQGDILFPKTIPSFVKDDLTRFFFMVLVKYYDELYDITSQVKRKITFLSFKEIAKNLLGDEFKCGRMIMLFVFSVITNTQDCFDEFVTITNFNDWSQFNHYYTASSKQLSLTRSILNYIGSFF